MLERLRRQEQSMWDTPCSQMIPQGSGGDSLWGGLGLGLGLTSMWPPSLETGFDRHFGDNSDPQVHLFLFLVVLSSTKFRVSVDFGLILCN